MREATDTHPLAPDAARPLGLILSGGGARGAFQVGALRALHEAGLRPDLLVGCSIGAVNAAAIALWGYDETGLYGLELAYQKVAASDILDLNMSRLAMQAISGRLSFDSGKRDVGFLDGSSDVAHAQIGELADVCQVAARNQQRPFVFDAVVLRQ